MRRSRSGAGGHRQALRPTQDLDLMRGVTYSRKWSWLFTLCNPGGPAVMETVELDDTVAHAEELLAEEASRTRMAQASTREATSSSFTMSMDDIASLRKRHAFLADFSDNFIRNTAIGDLMKIETTAIKLKEVEKSKDAADRLALNKSALTSTIITVPEARDNRWNLLHPARFLGGAGCSATRLWLAARENLGLTGHPPLGNYDMGAVGLAGHVSAKGWVELHNLAGSKLSIKLFNINNCGSRAGPKKSSAEEEYDNIA